MASGPNPKDLTGASPTEFYQAQRACEMEESHVESMEINGECPWCGTFDQSKWLPETEEA